MNRSDFTLIGFGVGLRRPHYAHVLERRPPDEVRPVDWFEVISENFMVEGGRPLEVLEGVRAQYPVVMHGVSLSIGSSDPLNRDYVRALRTLTRRFEPAWISDHLCWTGVGGRNLHDLLPLPYTEETVRHVAGRIREVQDILERTVLIENVSSYMAFRDSRLKEWEFLGAVAEEADCAILLDLNNIFVNAFNHRFDPLGYIDAVPADRVVQFHLAGHSDHGSYLLDTHDHPIRPEVWALYEHAVRRFGRVPTLIEWDDNIPEFEVLAAAADEARHRCEFALAAAAAAEETGPAAAHEPSVCHGPDRRGRLSGAEPTGEPLRADRQRTVPTSG
ncbi:MAG: MNIO family bufferin maturase [Candidatus Binataceae bacterium]